MKKVFARILLNLSLVVIAFSISSSASALTRDELIEKYPSLEYGVLAPENKKILCPFHRMLERAGLYDSSKREQSALTVTIIKITSLAQEFGCSVLACGGVATAVSTGQLAKFATLPGKVNLEALHRSLGISHECGLTFAKGGSEVSDEVRANTLNSLAELADEEGRLTLEDLQTVKENICAEQGVRNNSVGKTEVKLIFNFLGGQDRGFIDHSDVELFFNGQLPKTIGSPD